MYYSNSDCDNIEYELEEAKKYVMAHLVEDIDLRYNLRIKRNILGSFDKYHEKFMGFFKKLSHKKTSLQYDLKDKEDEFEIIKTELIIQTREQEESGEELEESRKADVELKTQLE